MLLFLVTLHLSSPQLKISVEVEGQASLEGLTDWGAQKLRSLPSAPQKHSGKNSLGWSTGGMWRGVKYSSLSAEGRPRGYPPLLPPPPHQVSKDKAYLSSD